MKNVITAMSLLAVTVGLAIPVQAAGSRGTAKTAFSAMVPHYEAIATALAADTTKGVSEHARAIGDIARKTAARFSAAGAGVPGAKADTCRALLPGVERAAMRLAASRNLAEAREAFGKLSVLMVRYRDMASGQRPHVVYCPMAKKPWLQESEKIANPYLGTKMLQCGKIVSD